ncbi:MAG: helix-turn-helix transcriptional regulator [Scrofimicrobium sp.]
MKYTAPLDTIGSFGLALQQARLAQGKSQSDIARELGIAQSAISEMESGHGTLYLRRLLDMAHALGLQLSASWEDLDAPRS